MRLKGKKIGILIESDFYEKEIFYYEHRFPEEGAELHFLTRLWGQPAHDVQGTRRALSVRMPREFRNMSDEALRVTQRSSCRRASCRTGCATPRTSTRSRRPPNFIERAFANPNILKGIICHGMWLAARARAGRGPQDDLHNNLIGDAKAYGVTTRIRTSSSTGIW